MLEFFPSLVLPCSEVDSAARHIYCLTNLLTCHPLIRRNMCMMDFLTSIAPSCSKLDSVARCISRLFRLVGPICQHLIRRIVCI